MGSHFMLSSFIQHALRPDPEERQGKGVEVALRARPLMIMIRHVSQPGHLDAEP